MKLKNLSLVMIFLLLICICATACGKKQDEQKNTLAATHSLVQTESTVGEVAVGVISEDVVGEEDDDVNVVDDIIIETYEETSPLESFYEDNASEDESDNLSLESAETTENTTDATLEATEPTTTVKQSDMSESEYEKYMNMSADEQQAFIESFPSLEAFMNWFNKAQEEHMANDDSVTIGSGVIDLEELTKMNQ